MAMARAAVECAYEGVRGWFEGLMGLGVEEKVFFEGELELWWLLTFADTSMYWMYTGTVDKDGWEWLGKERAKIKARISHLLCFDSSCCLTFFLCSFRPGLAAGMLLSIVVVINWASWPNRSHGPRLDKVKVALGYNI